MGGKVGPRLFIQMKKRWRIEEYFEVPKNLKESQAKLTEAWSEFRQVKESAPELRVHFIDTLIEEAEADGDEDKVRDLKNSKERERTKEAHDRIKFARGKMRGETGVSYIEKDAPAGRVPVRDKKDTITGIMESNATKLHQCNDGRTPLRSDPLEDLL